jgi:hypothetical protein
MAPGPGAFLLASRDGGLIVTGSSESEALALGTAAAVW